MKQCTVLTTGYAEFFTVYNSAIHRKLLLSRRPEKPPTGQDMEVYVEHRLASPSAIVDDQAVALRVEAFFVGYFLRRKEQMAHKHSVGLGHAMDFGNVPFGNH